MSSVGLSSISSCSFSGIFASAQVCVIASPLIFSLRNTVSILPWAPCSNATRYCGTASKRIGVSSSPGAMRMHPVPTQRSSSISDIARSKLL